MVGVAASRHENFGNLCGLIEARAVKEGGLHHIVVLLDLEIQVNEVPDESDLVVPRRVE